jgi:uncharacterized protein (DUF342 family)
LIIEVSIEEIEKRMKKLEIIYDEVLRERFAHIDERFNILEMRLNTLELRLNALYEKTESDKTELIERMERGLASLRVELIERMEKDKGTIILWFNRCKCSHFQH